MNGRSRFIFRHRISMRLSSGEYGDKKWICSPLVAQSGNKAWVALAVWMGPLSSHKCVGVLGSHLAANALPHALKSAPPTRPALNHMLTGLRLTSQQPIPLSLARVPVFISWACGAPLGAQACVNGGFSVKPLSSPNNTRARPAASKAKCASMPFLACSNRRGSLFF
jgi:hypothetical protein